LSVLSASPRPPKTSLDAVFLGTIPSGAGLSSSASIEVATGYAFLLASGIEVRLEFLALLAREAENEKVGVKCGIMDQFAVCMGRRGQAILLDCDSLHYSYCDLTLPGAKLVIANSNKPHELSDSGYNQRFAQCQAAVDILKQSFDIRFLCQVTEEQLIKSRALFSDELLFRRARHVVSENLRTVEAAGKLEAGDLAGFGLLMNESHASMRDDFEITCRELDVLTDLARSAKGVYGARMTGGGFGGCAVILVKEEAAEEMMRKVGEGYLAEVGYSPTFYLPEIGGGAEELAATPGFGG
jgi:galactokinase